MEEGRSDGGVRPWCYRIQGWCIRWRSDACTDYVGCRGGIWVTVELCTRRSGPAVAEAVAGVAGEFSVELSVAVQRIIHV